MDINNDNLIKEETILVIEDDQAIRETIRDILEVKKYVVDVASNGKEGLALIIKNNPSLVICDINMPIMNGFDLLESLNVSEEISIVPPFVFLTARSNNSDIRKGMELGADDYLLKPFNNSDLLAIVTTKINKRRKIQQFSTEKEQNRISRELHDSIQQLLAASLMGFNVIDKDLGCLDDNTKEIYNRSLSFLKEASVEVRNISHDIVISKEIDIKKKIEILLEQVNNTGKLVTYFSYNVYKEIENYKKIELFRIIQEALNNTLKHASAQSIRILLESNEDGGKLRINDDGVGFNISDSKSIFGLENMKKRAEKIKANYNIESIVNKGTTINLNWK
jgi:signal transduction histidine kinase